jgi:acyl carrier protein
MREIDQQAEREIRELVYDYFASECDIDRSRLTDETDIIEELEGDSLMLLSLLESVRRKYGLSVELKTLGRHLMNKPANTIGQIVELTLAIVRHGDDIVSLEL